MKKSLFGTVLLFAVATASILPVLPSSAAGSTSTSSVAESSSSTAAKLPYGVEDVLKLTRAQISEDIVLNYIQNSGTVYNLSPTDIVYLRNQGVPDRVINAMLDQRKKVPEAAAATAVQAPAGPSVAGNDANPAAAPADTQPAPVYVQPPAAEPAAAPSTVYVIPYPAASSAYYSYYTPSYGYGYYGGYYPGYYYRPGISFGFSFGGGHFGGRHFGGGHFSHHGGHRR